VWLRMSKFIRREERTAFLGASLLSAKLLAFIPVSAVFYVLLILPFFPDDGKGRFENVLIWPAAAMLTCLLVFRNRSRINYKFFLSLPVMSLIAYLLFAGASVGWAYNSELAFSRLVLQLLALIVVATPYALPINTKYTLLGVYLCFAIAFVVSAVYVLTIPPSPIGHPGYFTHKQELGVLGAAGIILASHEFLHRGWRRFLASVVLGLGFWLVSESESKSALAFALAALLLSALILMLCNKTRLTPAFFIGAVAIASMFVPNPVERLGHRLYGDSSLTGRTAIWDFANHQISRKPWLGWGFHSYFFVPNSPQNEAPGFVRDMPSSHSGYVDLKLETGYIGYWIFLMFLYSSLHLLERVRRKDPVRAWCYLSIELFAILINLTDTHWLVINGLWMLYLFAAVEAVHFSLPNKVPNAGHDLIRQNGYLIGRRSPQTAKLGGAAS
jgi:exopolysaccharide production protein ExoQ